MADGREEEEEVLLRVADGVEEVFVVTVEVAIRARDAMVDEEEEDVLVVV